ncbi:MAG: riboflavin synthase [bacterium]|nr:riboflavin synthase [bacterium]
MFTGIIETQARLEKIEKDRRNVHFTFSSSITPELRVDQSLAHNGVCLTVVKITNSTYQVTAIEETLKRSNLGLLQLGDRVNLERCMPADGRFDGHIVQGHVDATAVCAHVIEHSGSWEFVFEHEKTQDNLTVEKGSITINGVSLTVVSSGDTTFSVHIIPYTFENTNFKQIKQGSTVNLEFDVIGKYVAKILARK